MSSAAIVALTAPALAVSDRYEQGDCIDVPCAQQLRLEDGNRWDEKSRGRTEPAANRSSPGAVTDPEAPSAARALSSGDEKEDVEDEIGDAADEAGDEIGDTADEVGDEIGDTADEAGDEIDEAADEAGDEISSAADEAGDAVESGADEAGDEIGKAADDVGDALD